MPVQHRRSFSPEFKTDLVKQILSVSPRERARILRLAHISPVLAMRWAAKIKQHGGKYPARTRHVSQISGRIGSFEDIETLKTESKIYKGLTEMLLKILKPDLKLEELAK